MRTLSKPATLVFLLLLSVHPLGSQLQQPVAPINLIIDSDMSNSVDDVGDHALMWALANRGEVNVLAEICSSANDFSAPLMHALAVYYGHPNVLIGAHQGATPNLENSAVSNYAQQMVAQFGIPNDTRANYPDAVTVYRQALAGAPDHSVYIVANGFWQPLQALLQSPADSISPLTGMQLVTQKVVRLVPGAGFFPSGNEHNMRVDADAASFVYANWPVEIVNVGVEVSLDVTTGPDFSSSTTTDPVKASYIRFNGGNPVPGFGQLPLLFAVRGLAANFQVLGLNGQTTIETSTQPTPGQDNWFQTPQVGHSYLGKQATAAQLQAVLNPLLQGSSTMPIVRSISPGSVQSGSSGQTITLTGTNFFSDSQVQLSGSNRPTTFVSATQLMVQLSSSDVAQAGTPGGLTVVNNEGLGWTSNSLNLTITPGAAVNATLTGISPASAAAGSGSITLTVTGTNFASTSVVQVNGASRNTAFINSTQLTATLTASDLAAGGLLSINVADSSSGGTSGALTLTVNNPAPAPASISPNSVLAGGAAFTLTVNGSNFVSASVLQVNGSNRTTTFASGTQLSAAIPASDIASAGTLAITVVNPTPGGGSSPALTLTVNNPAPTLTSISPASVLAGGADFSLTANGSNFVNGAVIQVNGSNRTTTFVSTTQLSVTIPATDIASAGTLSITVINPGSGASPAIGLTVNNPAPTLTSISPNSVSAGGAAFTLTAAGSNFVNGSVIQVNGSNRTTSLISSTQLSAAIPAADIASTGTLSISATNPGPGGGSSASLTLTVNNTGPNPLPKLNNISPDTVVAGSGAFTMTLNGSNFVPVSVVQFNGSNRATTFVSSTQLTAAILASDVATPAFPSISVVNPTPGGGVWSLGFNVVNPLPTLTSLSPDTVIAGSGAFTMTLNGTNFIPASVVQVNGSNRATTLVSSTQLTAAILASDVATPGFPSIVVVNPAPGGGQWSLGFNVVNPAPTLINLAPGSVIAGSGGFTLTLTGSNFIPASQVQVNGSNRTTTFISSTQLTATIPGSDVAAAADLSVSVVNPAPGGGVWEITLPVTSP